MLDLRTYVTILLVIAAVGMFYIFRVIREQLLLFKKPINDKQVSDFRKKLFRVSLLIVGFGAIPITINVVSLFKNIGRPSHVPLVSVIYSLGVHVMILLLSYTLWEIYKLASKGPDE